MAIPRPSEVMRTVCVWDGAIDVPESKLTEFRASRDMDALTFRAGVKPTVYHLRPLDALCVTRFVETAPNESEQRERAFRAAVILIEDFRDFRDGGVAEAASGVRIEPRRYTEAAADGRGDLFDMWTNAELRAIHPAVVAEVGEVARWRSFFPPPTWPEFMLPPSSSRMLAMLTYQRAEQARRTLAETSSASAPASEPTPTP